MMNVPEKLFYTEEHEWVAFSEDKKVATVGITDFAQDQLGDIVFVGLPEIGDVVNTGDSLADIESVKSVSDIYSPVSGKVVEVNEALLDQPELVNEAPYDQWLFKIEEVSGIQENLLQKEAYENLIAEEA
ncbi:glycine cleavage system protein GcvH [Vagococcus lutrae]|nr:glycine cleavage system protein GcvH [Vagococcus lutrae]MCO7150890.1 glycine cleavage system protein GcvH [Vagococcus lutrae]MDT2812362.1 glycine cleavage system protein GcvH [Vagococcus lutrae]MDT2819234.1 glycine cleavage system protein GcvH [Vagococcus lutrae]MDT2844031.1 glycine cleavage system protein GcvH [Vagococcus lutrae]WCG06053.1 glycine cleavage system protein GcvH [Vagococcus lutrae]